MEFAQDALKALPDHPVVLALVSQIKLKLTEDIDKIAFFGKSRCRAG